MALSPEEQAYLDRHPTLRRITFTGANDLYVHLVYGARTIADCMEMDELRKKLTKRNVAPTVVTISPEMEAQHERCVDEHGCGLY